MKHTHIALFALSTVALACGEVEIDPDAAPMIDTGINDDGGGGEAELAIDKEANDFGTVLIDQSSAAAAFVVTNDGVVDTGALSTSLGGAGAAHFAISADDCAGTSLAPAASCTISVTFSPTGAGSHAATLAVSGSPGGSVEAALSGTGVAPGALSVSPDVVPFGGVLVGATSAASTVTVTNTGGATSGALAVALTGTDAGYFDFTSNDCAGATLAAGATCTITLTFTPNASGARAASLSVSANPGGAAVAALSGTGLAPATLSMSPTTHGFGNVLVGATSATRAFTVTNGGDVASGTLTTSKTGAGASQFPTTADTCNGQTLAGGASCTVTLAFSPTSDGAKAATLAVAGSPGGSGSATLSGTGQDPAVLGAAVSSNAFGLIEVNQSSAAFTWTITNGGDVPTGTLSITNNNPSDYTTSTTCGTTLAANSSCNVTVTFQPANGGVRTGQVSVSASPGGSVALGVSGTGGWRLTIAKTGTGTVSSVAAGISCGADCFEVYAPGTSVALEARATNGSNYSFHGFGGGGCPPLERFCTVTVNAAMTVSALFAVMPNNMIFVSSQSFATNLGSAAAYDTQCNLLATAAGINTASNNGYIAVTSDANSAAISRLGNARGWRRMDGRGFADDQNDLFNNNEVFNSVTFDENGEDRSTVTVMTATGPDGTPLANNCSNFTSTSGSMNGGVAAGGPLGWISQSGFGCGTNRPVICMGVSKFNQMTPTVTAGKRIYVSASVFRPGVGEAPDTRCVRDSAPGVNTVKALVAYDGVAAAAVLDPNETYVRMDGTLIGRGSEIAALGLQSGMWQTNSGSYSVGFRVWTGQTSLTAPGTAATTCNSWTSSSAQASAHTGWPDVSRNWFWTFTNQNCDFTAARLYCVEQ